MPIGPGGLDSNGIWQFGEDDSEALASDLLNLGMGSVSTAISTLGGVLQVVSTTKTDTFTASLAVGAETAITGLSATITPVATSSTIFVVVSVGMGNGTNFDDGQYFTVFRDSTAVGRGDEAGNRQRVTGSSPNGISSNDVNSVGVSFEDSPAATTALVYSVKVSHSSNSTSSVFVNRSSADVNLSRRQRTISTITLWEVAG